MRELLLHDNSDSKKLTGISILLTIRDIPPEQRRTILKNAIPLIEGIASAAQKTAILCAVYKISEQQRDAICLKVAPFLLDIHNGYQRGAMLQASSLILEQQRTETVLQSMVAIFKNIPGDSTPNDYVNLIQSIPEEQRGAFCLLFAKAIQEIPDAEKETFLQDLSTFFMKSYLGANKHYANAIKLSECTAFMLYQKALLEKIWNQLPPEDRGHFLLACMNIKEEPQKIAFIEPRLATISTQSKMNLFYKGWTKNLFPHPVLVPHQISLDG